MIDGLGLCRSDRLQMELAPGLELGGSLDEETMQLARTSDRFVSVPRLISERSAALPLRCGDVILAGTPAGVDMASNPARSLTPGQVLDSWIKGIGTMRNRCVRLVPVERSRPNCVDRRVSAARPSDHLEKATQRCGHAHRPRTSQRVELMSVTG